MTPSASATDRQVPPLVDRDPLAGYVVIAAFLVPITAEVPRPTSAGCGTSPAGGCGCCGEFPEGPYRWLRHPSYAGTLVTSFGLSLAFGSWVGAVLATVSGVFGHVPRIRVEETELREGLGEAYDGYARTTARLVPRVW